MNLRQTTCVMIAAISLLTASVCGADDALDRDRLKIMETFPELSAGAIMPSPIPGLYEIMMRGQISYVSADGQFLLQGDVYDAKKELNLTESRREVARQAVIDQIGESSMIVFAPEETMHTVTVFTDIDCGYCRKLHRQIAEYNDLGIKVRYLFFPRSGPDTTSWFKAEKVWCSDDRNKALTSAKSGGMVDSEDCRPTPVAQHYELGRAIGIRGTPAIVAQSGELIPGYVPPEELLEFLSE